MKSKKHQNHFKSLFPNHAEHMKQIDNFLDDINNFNNYLN
jgi:hypothetical protein